MSAAATVTSTSPGSAQNSAGPRESNSCHTWARASGRTGSLTWVVQSAGGSAVVGHGRRSTGTAPDLARTRASSSGLCRAATAAAVRARSNLTPPVRESTTGASLTASTAVNPTPKWPTSSLPCLAEARSEANPITPAAVSGAPLLATRSSSPSNSTSTRAGSPAAAAASTALAISSTRTRSR